jgi:hypothetical protein
MKNEKTTVSVAGRNHRFFLQIRSEKASIQPAGKLRKKQQAF